MIQIFYLFEEIYNSLDNLVIHFMWKVIIYMLISVVKVYITRAVGRTACSTILSVWY
jgi:hypothetical protein